MEESLSVLIGSHGRQSESALNEKRTLRMQMMVDIPAAFETALNNVTFRNDVVSEVEFLLNQTALEEGGSFESDASFTALSGKIVGEFSKPALKFVEDVAAVVSQALLQSCSKSFSDYPLLYGDVLNCVGITATGAIAQKRKSLLGGDDDTAHSIFGFLYSSAQCKVVQLLDSFACMTSYHPMWLNFSSIYSRMQMMQLNLAAAAGDPKPKMDKKEEDTPGTLEEILRLGELSKAALLEGNYAIAEYEKRSQKLVPRACKDKIKKHFARIQVMAYVIRSSLVSTVPPLVLRDLRDGLFRGARVGLHDSSEPIGTCLRRRLAYDTHEQKLFASMEPNREDVQRRDLLVKKLQMLTTCRDEYNKCQDSLKRLSLLFT